MITKAALTIWENRISPVFDSASSLLLVDYENQQIVNRTIEPFDANQIAHLVKMLLERNICCFICGAITQPPAELIRSNGINFFPFVSGNLEDILSNLICGNPIIPRFLMPGCQQKRCNSRQSQLNQRKVLRNSAHCNHQRKRFNRCCSTRTKIDLHSIF